MISLTLEYQKEERSSFLELGIFIKTSNLEKFEITKNFKTTEEAFQYYKHYLKCYYIEINVIGTTTRLILRKNLNDSWVKNTK
jgi:hypothetical protein